MCLCLNLAHICILVCVCVCSFCYLSNQIFVNPESSFSHSSQQAVTSTQLRVGEDSNFPVADPNSNIQ